MAKISNLSYRGFSVNINYKSKSYAFCIKLPDEMNSYSQINGEITAKTQMEVEKEFRRIVDNYLIEKCERIKFIAINADDDSRCNDEYYRAGGEKSFMELNYALVERVKINGRFFYKYKTGPSDRTEHTFYDGNETVFIKWTKEREEYLNKTVKAINELAKKVKEFITSEEIEVLIDNKRSLLGIEVLKCHTEK